ncbi:MAG: hypothetical protein GY771_10190 [bacterium]|nr:hypothetical protein [bacterium]
MTLIASMTVRIFRFAPAPTGALHVGNLWVYHVNRRLVDDHGGILILRVDDTNVADPANFLRDFKALSAYLGIRFDSVIYQSTRRSIYLKALGLKEFMDRVYRDDGAVFLKFKPDPIEFYDGVRRAKVRKKMVEISSPVIRSNGGVNYHWASVVDDVLLGITDVVRASDHLDNTCVQCALSPSFSRLTFHLIPLIYASDGLKISKSNRDHQAYSIMNILYEGIPPAAL